MLKFDWDEANRKHIAVHSVSPEEAEEALLNDALELSYEIVAGEEPLRSWDEQIPAASWQSSLRGVTVESGS